LLNDNGICGLITPNTYFYTETAKKMRNNFAKHKCIKQITNYAEIQLFDNVTTYSAITIFGKQKHNNIKKIIFSPMNKKPNFIYYENEECTFYSGYCIKYKGDYNSLLDKLNSDEMQRFVQMSSRDFRGGWKAYNKKVIEEFVIDLV